MWIEKKKKKVYNECNKIVAVAVVVVVFVDDDDVVAVEGHTRDASDWKSFEVTFNGAWRSSLPGASARESGGFPFDAERAVECFFFFFHFSTAILKLYYFGIVYIEDKNLKAKLFKIHRGEPAADRKKKTKKKTNRSSSEARISRNIDCEMVEFHSFIAC